MHTLLIALGTANFWLVLGTWALALIGYIGVRSADRASESQLNAMHAAERPFIGIDEASESAPTQSVVLSTVPKPHTPIHWNIAIRNYGKSTATLQYKVRVKVGDRDFECGADGDAMDSAQSCDWSPPMELVPTQRNKVTVFSKTRVTEDEFKSYLTMDEGIVAHIRVRYTDAYGTVYPHIICMEHEANGSVGDCAGKYDPE